VSGAAWPDAAQPRRQTGDGMVESFVSAASLQQVQKMLTQRFLRIFRHC